LKKKEFKGEIEIEFSFFGYYEEPKLKLTIEDPSQLRNPKAYIIEYNPSDKSRKVIV